MDPYRTERSAVAAHTRGGARDFIAPFALLWVVSLIRVLAALVDGRPFGAIDTLAVISLLLLPWALARGRVRTR